MPPSYSDEDEYGSDVNDPLDGSAVTEKGTSVIVVVPFLKRFSDCIEK